MLRTIIDNPSTIKKLKRHVKATGILVTCIFLLVLIVELARAEPETMAVLFCIFVLLCGLACMYAIIYSLFTE
ncbi:HNH DNAse [Proteus phage PM 93]|uniref:HNH DNAse n=1 Tax=Proteus phage PM 93 TaxID=1560284 RepID=A0A0U3AHI0_9CAUD|nr:HNH DNAse [Proteus phage PM 93]ALS88294.1 HNH DNAse [Proteus phage PM 93]